MRTWHRLLLIIALLALPGLAEAAGRPATPNARPMPANTTVTTTRTIGGAGGAGHASVTAHAVAPRPGKARPAGAQPLDGGDIFNCSYGAGQSWSTPSGPYMYYSSGMQCSSGTPVRNVTVLESAYVLSPTSFTVVASQPQECNGANPCNTPQYQYDASATQILEACGEPVVMGTDGYLYDLAPFCVSYPYNDNGGGYPTAPPYAQFPIPFPGPGYTQQTTRDPDFLTNVKAYYTANKLPMPPCEAGDAIEAHHIKPISFGGDNTIGGPNNNAVLLCHSDHYFYTTWWGSPTYGPFTPS